VEMGLLANFKIRTKVLAALFPLVVMVLVAALYSSIEMKTIDTLYSDLIARDVKALQNLTAARALDNRFGLFLYKEIVALDSDRIRMIDADLDETVAQFHSAVEQAKRNSPSLAPEIKAATALFDQAVSDSRPIRAATLSNNNDKAMKLMRETVEPEMAKVRQAFIGLAEESSARVDRRSDELTAKTHRMILITWIVIALGLVASLIIALFVVRVEVVQVVSSFRSLILEVAEGRLDQSIGNLAR